MNPQPDRDSSFTKEKLLKIAEQATNSASQLQQPQAGGWGAPAAGQQPQAGGWGGPAAGQQPQAGGWGSPNSGTLAPGPGMGSGQSSWDATFAPSSQQAPAAQDQWRQTQGGSSVQQNPSTWFRQSN